MKISNHQPLHAIMVLLTEVDKFPFSPEAESCRFVIDEAFALCGPEGGMTGTRGRAGPSRPLSEGGKESWDLMNRLRTRAWKKAGLDPHAMVSLPFPTRLSWRRQIYAHGTLIRTPLIPFPYSGVETMSLHSPSSATWARTQPFRTSL